MTGTLEIEGVYTAYDKADVLQGVSLKVDPAASLACLVPTAQERRHWYVQFSG